MSKLARHHAGRDVPGHTPGDPYSAGMHPRSSSARSNTVCCKVRHCVPQSLCWRPRPGHMQGDYTQHQLLEAVQQPVRVLDSTSCWGPCSTRCVLTAVRANANVHMVEHGGSAGRRPPGARGALAAVQCSYASAPAVPVPVTETS